YTFQAKVDYDPSADSTVLDNALDAMLTIECQNILLRTLASVLDISKIRATHGRCPRALLLIGQGSNGKDTVRAWMVQLFGEQVFSAISLETFYKADRN